jgi:hypothetical protein
LITPRFQKHLARTALAGLLPFLFLSPLQAASVAIDSLNVNTLNFIVAIDGGGTYNVKPPNPNFVIHMGTYQDPLAMGSFVDATGVLAGDWTLSTKPPNPNMGTVDASTGTIAVDFSSLWAHVTLPVSGQLSTFGFSMMPPGPPVMPVNGTYDAASGAFMLDWSQGFSTTGTVDATGAAIDVSGTARLTLGGSVTTVPVPGAVWLLGSGLLGLIGLAGKKSA